MNKLFILLILILCSFNAFTQYNAFGIGVSVNKNNQKDLTSLDLSYILNNYYIEISSNNLFENSNTDFNKLNVGFLFKSNKVYYVPYFGVIYKNGNFYEKINMGIYIISNVNNNLSVIGGLGFNEKIKVGLLFKFN